MDIDDDHAVRVIFGTRIGDDFDVLDLARGEHLHDLGRIVLKERARFVIHIDLVGLRALDTHLVFPVYGDHGDTAHHVEQARVLGIGVVLDLVGHLVGLYLDQPLLRSDRCALQMDHASHCS